jgi:iron(III) transport system ATP-binding protein
VRQGRNVGPQEQVSGPGHGSAKTGQSRNTQLQANPSADIHIAGLTVAYGDVVAVKDLSLEVPHGQMAVLLGPSGCGKTSTMRSIVGLESPTAGVIRVGGSVLFDADAGIDIPPNKRGIGLVFQSYAIWPHKTVFENVTFPLRMLRLPKSEREERTTHALELVGMAELATRSASRLSGGQMQRVALARGLVTDPPVLLFDEPLSNLDAKLRERIRYELKEIQQRLSLTSVYVTHDQSEALVLADKLVIMEDGRILQEGPPSEIFEAPRNRQVAEFLGISNLFRAAVSRIDGDIAQVNLVDYPLSFHAAATGVESSRLSANFRPEAIQLTPRNNIEDGQQNIWPGRVESAHFLGDHYRYKVTLDFDLSFEVITYARRTIFSRGDDVSLKVDPRDVQLFPDE